MIAFGHWSARDLKNLAHALWFAGMSVCMESLVFVVVIALMVTLGDSHSKGPTISETWPLALVIVGPFLPVAAYGFLYVRSGQPKRALATVASVFALHFLVVLIWTGASMLPLGQTWARQSANDEIFLVAYFASWGVRGVVSAVFMGLIARGLRARAWCHWISVLGFMLVGGGCACSGLLKWFENGIVLILFAALYVLIPCWYGINSAFLGWRLSRLARERQVGVSGAIPS